jgi:hypothetical protein
MQNIFSGRKSLEKVVKNKKVKQPPYRPGVSQRVPGN